MRGRWRWLRETAGEDSAEYRDAVDGQADAEIFLSALRDLAAALGAVYGGDLPRDGKLARKSALISGFRGEFDARVRPRFRTSRYRDMDLPPINNAVLSLYGLYADDVPLIREYCATLCAGDLRVLIDRCRDFARTGDVKEQMRRALGRP